MDSNAVLRHVAGMKRWGAKVAIALFAVFAIADIVHELVANDPVRYFASQPSRLLLVAAIAIPGGLVTFGLLRLSPPKKLLILGSAIAGLLVAAGFLTFEFVNIPPQLRAGISVETSVIMPFSFVLVISVICLEFWQIWKKRSAAA